MLILAIDPGDQFSAYCLYSTDLDTPLEYEKLPNSKIKELIKTLKYEKLVIEMVKSYGAVIGDTILNTCVAIGQFTAITSKEFVLIPRKTVVSVLCHSGRAGDKEVRRVLIDKFGRLKGAKLDVWAAIGVGAAYAELQKDELGKICL